MNEKLKTTGYPNYFPKRKQRCLNCGKWFISKYYNKNKFCSIRCSYQYRKKDKVNWDKYIDKLKAMRGLEKHPNWQGGKSFEPYGVEFNEDLREVIRNRDRRKCFICDRTELGEGKKLCVHHIDYDKRNNNPNNLISLCGKCHGKTNYNRKKWIEFFKKYENI